MTLLEKLIEWNGGINRGARRRFAKALGVTDSVVSQWVQGNRKPGEETIIKIARLFKINREEAISLLKNIHVHEAVPSSFEKLAAEMSNDMAIIKRRLSRLEHEMGLSAIPELKKK